MHMNMCKDAPVHGAHVKVWIRNWTGTQVGTSSLMTRVGDARRYSSYYYQYLSLTNSMLYNGDLSIKYIGVIASNIL